MFEGGVSFNKESDRAIRLIALLGTPVFVGYNVLVLARLAPSLNYVNDTICLVISALWIAVGAYHFFVPIRSRIDMFARLVLYHGLALATVMFITGFWEPFASSIALLFLASNVYFGRNALIASIASVILAGAIDIIMRYSTTPDILLSNVLGVLGILILGIAMVGVISAQETRRRALLESQAQERLQYDRILTIINNLTDATFSTDEKGIIRLFNAASLDLLDTNDNLIGKPIDSFLNLTDDEKHSVRLTELLSSSDRATRSDSLRHTYADGEIVRLEITYAPIRSANSRQKKNEKTEGGYIVIMRDITKAKSLEEERDEFISVVSHELRTPITIIEGTLSNLQMMTERNTTDKATVSSAVTMAHDQSLYLAKMVNDLSTLSRAERGVADAPEEINVSEMIHKLYNQYHPNALEKKLHLNLDLGPDLGTINASRLYVEELLQNFITNSIKYTKEGSITVIVKKTKNKIHFSVKDTGIGISRSDQTKIFNKFYRSEDYRIRETSGTGLGLYVSTKLAHKIGTKIELKSRINHGSTFSFTLPSAE